MQQIIDFSKSLKNPDPPRKSWQKYAYFSLNLSNTVDLCLLSWLVNHFVIILGIPKSQKSRSTKEELIKIKTCPSWHKSAPKLG